MKEYRILVQTGDGCTTIWYEKSRAKDATNKIKERVCNQLQGLFLTRVDVYPLKGVPV